MKQLIGLGKETALKVTFIRTKVSQILTSVLKVQELDTMLSGVIEWYCQVAV